GVAEIDGQTYELRPDAADGRHLLAEVDTSRLPPLEPEMAVGPVREKPDPSQFRALGHLGADLAPVVHDVLVLYTAASARRYGTSTLQSMIVGGVAAANEAYRASGVGITLQLAGLQQAVTIAETRGGMVDTLWSLARSAEASDLRDRHAADIVLLVNESDDWCGYAYIMHDPNPAYASQAYGAVQARCLSSEAIAHEVGHIQGLVHDRDTRDEDGALPYGHGYRLCQRGGFRDVMSYQCPNVDVPRVRLFSNPARSYRGVPTGIAHETDPGRSADAARALNETAPLVAAYRIAEAAVDAPRPPVGLTASVRRGVARLDWRARDPQGLGFAVDRSSGGDFTEIARVDSDVTRFVDTTVARPATYSYRVRSLATDGASSTSEVVTVTIRDRHGRPVRDVGRRELPR
ncbi:MAG TPA: M12 family metallo-peptidase, partial [Steroidobacteraceae bacterium]|nr:M12 family metallo-peptidase [Steroidobacteraceae bacterium]